VSYLPTLAQLAGLIGVAVAAAAFLALGAAAGGGGRRSEGDLVAGWGVATAAFVAFGALGGVALGWITAGVFAAAVPCSLLALRRTRHEHARALLIAAVLSVPLIVVVAAMSPSQWDEFTHWLPNARYLVEHGDFPRAGIWIPSSQPSYPYALPLVAYMASQLAGRLDLAEGELRQDAPQAQHGRFAATAGGRSADVGGHPRAVGA